MKKRLTAIILALLLVGGCLAGCGQTAEPAGEKPAQTDAPVEDAYIKVNVGIDGDPGAFGPWLGTGVNGRIAIQIELYEALFSLETFGGEPIPCLAEGYEQIDPYTYRVKIHENIYDSAGNHITADDVVFSFETAAAQGNCATYLTSYAGIAKVDDYTVDLTLNSTEIGGFLNTTTFIYIVSQKAYEADPDGFAMKPIGTGPYVLKSFTPGSGAILVKNENYWQGENPQNLYGKQNCDEIEYKVITESAQFPIALETGVIDFSNNVSQSDLYLFDNNDAFQVISRPAALAEILQYNCSEKSHCQDINLRKAICYAIDTEAILISVFEGNGAVCKTYGSGNYSDYQKSWENEDYYEYDVEKAKEYLANSSYNGETLRLMCVPGDKYTRTCELIQSYLSDAGINCEILVYDGTLFNTYRFDDTQWDISMQTKGSGDYLANCWKYNFDARLFGGKTQTFTADEQLQALLETCLNTDTHNAENVNAFHSYLKDIAIGYGLMYGYDNFVVSNNISEVVLTPMNMLMPGACVYNQK